ncbi:hypothetical protein BV22DRAFT_235293 [Leucogyrophana mollusca]|uniref:Uncharacterized protein n=1 Tax=Leucogyrophana mollusca TaxID=85980 RepID=A0ACB8BS80_9AGAM|nr:hypothetical protein BV22DRAFT_235293 [Leucogyrophana mollusca]
MRQTLQVRHHKVRAETFTSCSSIRVAGREIRRRTLRSERPKPKVDHFEVTWDPLSGNLGGSCRWNGALRIQWSFEFLKPQSARPRPVTVSLSQGFFFHVSSFSIVEKGFKEGFRTEQTSENKGKEFSRCWSCKAPAYETEVKEMKKASGGTRGCPNCVVCLSRSPYNDPRPCTLR